VSALSPTASYILHSPVPTFAILSFSVFASLFLHSTAGLSSLQPLLFSAPLVCTPLLLLFLLLPPATKFDKLPIRHSFLLCSNHD